MESLLNYTEYLEEIFPNKSIMTINEIIDTVINEIPHDSVEYQLDTVIDLLSNTAVVCGTEQNTNDQINYGDEGLLDVAAGVATTIHDSTKYRDQLLEIFSDACPLYIENLCHRRSKTYNCLDMFIDEITEADYPKKKPDPKPIFKQLKEMLPNADPSYLEEQANALAYQSDIHLKMFVEDAIDNGEYPTMENYIKNQKIVDEIKQYTTEFNILIFLKQFPDPEKHFMNANRKPSLISTTSIENEYNEDEAYALNFLYNYYIYLRRRNIKSVFIMFSKHLIRSCEKLDKMRRGLKTPRSIVIPESIPKNISLLQEIAYLKHKKEIRRILKDYDVNYRRAKKDAQHNDLLQTCACCFDEELIPEECHFCKNGCIFCKDCVKGGAEHVIGEGKTDFPCLADCGAEFSIPTLQMVLDSSVFSRMAQRKQIDEIKRANLDGLETCPFCDFATIPPADDKLFRCLNTECMKESCRKCRHIAHIPLSCNEIEYDEDVKMRTYIENKMTEALLRKCWRCSTVFIKESGCNKMTCSCGAKLCYLCGEAVTDYQHFGENGSRCPLYTLNLNRLHADAVLRGATAAKEELGIDKNPNKLKFDPTNGIENHYSIDLLNEL